MSLLLSVDHIQCYHHRDHPIVDGLSFTVNSGEIICILGASGCGKTTALRAIAGLEKITHGEIRLKSQLLSSKTIHIPPQSRQIGLVFQENTLFPHLNVYDNIAFGLDSLSHSQKDNRIKKLLSLIKLDAYKKHYPHQLSGGQQQRIALARALAPKPQLILLDEPFSSLDTSLKQQLQFTVKALLKEEGTTAILVTHDHQEAFMMASKIGVMHQGKIMQWDSPFNLYHNPISKHIANFLGAGYFISGEYIDDNKIKTELGLFQINQNKTLSLHANVDVLIRPSDIYYDENSSIFAKIIDKTMFGATTRYTLELANKEAIEAIFPSHFNFEINAQISIRADIKDIILF